MFGAVRVTGLSDVKSPKDSGDGDKERLLSNLLSGTDSSSPTKRRVSRLRRIREVLLQETIWVEGMWIGIILGIVIDLSVSLRYNEKVLEEGGRGSTAHMRPRIVDPLGI